MHSPAKTNSQRRQGRARNSTLGRNVIVVMEFWHHADKQLQYRVYGNVPVVSPTNKSKENKY